MVSNLINDFDYLLVLDFEAQCDENTKLKCQEIIEFPVIIVDVQNQKVLEVYFHKYVKPIIYPTLFNFCTKLTGITQDKVDTGETLDKVLEKFHSFLEETGIIKNNFTFVTCGDWDLGTCLHNEAKYKKLIYKDYFNNWINIKKVFGSLTGYTKVGMTGMLKEFNIKLVGKHHSGIDDTRNISSIVLHLLEEGIQFKKHFLSYNNKK